MNTENCIENQFNYSLVSDISNVCLYRQTNDSNVEINMWLLLERVYKILSLKTLKDTIHI